MRGIGSKVSNSSDRLPGITKDLVEALEKAYPPRCIGTGETPEQAHRYAGKVELVAHLRTLYDDWGDSTTLTPADLGVQD